MSNIIKHTEKTGLQLGSITLNENYRKQWNIHQNDFFCLVKDGELISDTLYRVGGFGKPELGTDRYFMLLKHVEAYYPDNITKVKKDKPHLESRWCIIDHNGVEKVEFPPFKSPYLVKDSCLYSIGSDYYNIETGEHYCNALGGKVESNDFLFLQNTYDQDESKRGVMKINKKTGDWELFK